MKMDGVCCGGRFRGPRCTAVIGNNGSLPRVGHFNFAIFTANDIEVVIDSIVHDGVTGTAFKRRSCRFENELFEACNIYCVGGRVHVDAVIIGFNENDSRCSDFAV